MQNQDQYTFQTALGRALHMLLTQLDQLHGSDSDDDVVGRRSCAWCCQIVSRQA